MVMYLPEKMNAASGNALLKMVEEPPEKTLFLLVTHAPESVLTTIASRCLHLRVEPLSRQALSRRSREVTCVLKLMARTPPGMRFPATASTSSGEQSS